MLLRWRPPVQSRFEPRPLRFCTGHQDRGTGYGESLKHRSRLIRVVEVGEGPGGVQQEQPEKHHKSREGGCKSGCYRDHDAHAASNQRDSAEASPKNVFRNPGGDERRDKRRVEKMFDTQNARRTPRKNGASGINLFGASTIAASQTGPLHRKVQEQNRQKKHGAQQDRHRAHTHPGKDRDRGKNQDDTRGTRPERMLGNPRRQTGDQAGYENRVEDMLEPKGHYRYRDEVPSKLHELFRCDHGKKVRPAPLTGSSVCRKWTANNGHLNLFEYCHYHGV